MNHKKFWILVFCGIALLVIFFWTKISLNSRDATTEMILNLQSTSLNNSDDKNFGLQPFVGNKNLQDFLNTTNKTKPSNSTKTMIVMLAEPNSSLYSILKIDIYSVDDINASLFVIGSGIHPIEVNPQRQRVINSAVDDLAFELLPDAPKDTIRDGVTTKIILRQNHGTLTKITYGNIPKEISTLFQDLGINPRSTLLKN